MSEHSTLGGAHRGKERPEEGIRSLGTGVVYRWL